jgi:general secretion pathway protein J
MQQKTLDARLRGHGGKSVMSSVIPAQACPEQSRGAGVQFVANPLASRSSPRMQGFTLLEVMVACAILSLVLAALYGVFSRTLTSKRMAEERVARARAARVVLLRIGEDLRGSFPLATAYGGFAGETRRREDFPTASLSFISTAHPLLTSQASEGGLCRIGYRLVSDSTMPTRYQLVRSVQLDIRADQDATENEMTLLRQVRGLRFRFFDGQNWIEEWGVGRPRGRLPYAVEMTLFLEGPRDEGVTFSTVTDLPLAGSPRPGVS